MSLTEFSLSGTLGAAFLGHSATAILYGITSLQTFVYFKLHYTDALPLRVLVSLIWVLDSLHFSLITVTMYHYLVSNFGNLSLVSHPTWTILAMVIVSNVNNVIIRGIIVWRLWRLALDGFRTLYPFVITILSFYVFGVGLYFGIHGTMVQSFFDVSEFSWTLFAGFGGEVILDGLIVMGQVQALRRFKTGVKRMDSVIQILTTYIINTGLLTSICALLCLITYVILPHKYVYFPFYFVLSKLYVNALLGTLNARGPLRDMMNAPNSKRPNSYTKSNEPTDLEYSSERVTIQLSSIIDLRSMGEMGNHH